jgi:hypothetical protein
MASVLFGYQGLRHPGPTDNLSVITHGVKNLLRPEYLTDIRFYLFLAVAIFIGNSIAPSWSDTKNSAMGIITLAFVLFILNSVAHMTRIGIGGYVRSLPRIGSVAVNIGILLIMVNGVLYLVLKGVQTVIRGKR